MRPLISATCGLVLIGCALFPRPGSAQSPTIFTAFHPGVDWPADDGVNIDAHGGNILLDPKSKKYYWFGERRGSPRGVGCYSSLDLYNWKNEGVAMTAAAAGLTGMVFERPKVLYSAAAGKYVLWYHHDDAQYALAHLGVATSDKINGPYVSVGHWRPNGHESRDLSLFVDDDGKAYIFYSADNNSTIRVVALSDDYLSLTTRDADTKAHCEGEGIFKKAGVYYLMSSACSGWSPNQASYATATDIMGPYTGKGNPAIGDTAKTTFNSQPSFVFTIPGYQDGYLYMGDRWNGSGTVKSQYVFLPIAVTKSGTMELRWYGTWDLSRFTLGSTGLISAHDAGSPGTMDGTENLLVRRGNRMVIDGGLPREVSGRRAQLR